MDRAEVTLQVFFEDPFWVGIVERTAFGKLEVSRIVFGAEPRDCEIYRYVTDNYYRLRFSPAVETVVKERHTNPKRLQKEAKKMVVNAGIGTKSQQALKLQQEQFKMIRRAFSRQQKEEEKERMFELKQQKRKEKHKGR